MRTASELFGAETVIPERVRRKQGDVWYISIIIGYKVGAIEYLWISYACEFSDLDVLSRDNLFEYSLTIYFESFSG